MVTPGEIEKKTMTPGKRKGAKYDIFAFYVGRPISYVLSVPFIEFHVRPNVISLLSFIPSIIGFVLLGFGTSETSRIIGALFFMLWNFMDGIDGNTARYYNQPSKMGRLWDATSGYLATMLLYFAMGLCTMNVPMPKGSLLNVLNFPDYYYVALGGLTSMNMLFYRLVMHKKMVLYTEAAGKGLNDKATYTLPMIIALNLTSTAGFMQVLMITSVLTDFVREFTVFFYLLQFAVMIRTLFIMLSLDSDDYLE